MNNSNLDEIINYIKSNISFIKELNFTNQEISENIIKILDIHKELTNCQNNLDSNCISIDGMHEHFYRNNNHELKTSFYPCKKISHEVKGEYFIQHFDNKFLDCTFSKKYIDTKEENGVWRKNLLKLLNEQLKTENFNNLYLSGDFGIGKTYIFALFANSLIKQGKNICFINSNTLMNIFKKNKYSYSSTNEFLDIVNKMELCDVLIMDEIGSETFDHSFHIDYLMAIIINRFQSNKPTYFLSNFDLKKLKLKYHLIGKKFFNSIEEKECYKTIIDKFVQTICSTLVTKEINLLGKNWRE